jgi:hypothetical protein
VGSRQQSVARQGIHSQPTVSRQDWWLLEQPSQTLVVEAVVLLLMALAVLAVMGQQPPRLQAQTLLATERVEEEVAQVRPPATAATGQVA